MLVLCYTDGGGVAASDSQSVSQLRSRGVAPPRSSRIFSSVITAIVSHPSLTPPSSNRPHPPESDLSVELSALKNPESSAFRRFMCAGSDLSLV